MYTLYSHLDTGQYVWNGVLSDVKEFIASIPDGETLDIARCRFDPACLSAVTAHIGRIKVINSQEEDLNNILERSYRIKTRTTPVKRAYVKGEFYDRDGYRFRDFLAEFKASDKDLVWCVSEEAARGEYADQYAFVLFGCLLQFPKRIFDLSNVMSYVDKLQGKFRLEDYLRSKTIQLCFGNAAYTEHKFINDNGDVDMNGIGIISTAEAITKYRALPGWVGKERVVNDDRINIVNEVWKHIKLVSQIPRRGEPTTMAGMIDKYGGV